MSLSPILLSLLIWFPILGGVFCIFLGQKNMSKDGIRWVAAILSLITLLFCIPLYLGFDKDIWQMQFVEFLPWVPAFHMNYSLGVDGISLLFIITL